VPTHRCRNQPKAKPHFFLLRLLRQAEGREIRADADTVGCGEFAYPCLRCAAAPARRGPEGLRHPGVARGPAAHALLRDDHASARSGRDNSGSFNRSRPAAHDPRVTDDRGQGCPDIPARHRRPSVSDAAPRSPDAASDTSAAISREDNPFALAPPPARRPSASWAPSW
jgi:hypothetical protein